MVASINSDYSSRKGIYKDLYRELNADNKKKEASKARRPRKGIYVEMYKQIEFKNNEWKEKQKNIYILAFNQAINDLSSRVSYLLASATGQIKMLIVAFMVAKEPINSYIESNCDIYQNSIQ